MSASRTRGNPFAELLESRLRRIRRGRRVDGRNRTIIEGVTPRGTMVRGMTLDAFAERGAQALIDSGRVYTYGNTTVFEHTDGDNPALVPLAVQLRAEPGAAAVLGNLVGTGVRTDDGVVESPLTQTQAALLLADEGLHRRLPRVRHYSRRPVFDDEFRLCEPGWSGGSGILVHGPAVEPVTGWTPETGVPPLERLPVHTRAALAEFNWASPADLANAVGVLLTGLLINHFIDDPHPLVIVDANQRGVGKTLLVATQGRILDGVEPPRLRLAGDDELEKKLGAHLRQGQSSFLFLDNVRSRIDSPLIEANALSPTVQVRVLGQSSNVTRPNGFLWVVTANQAAATEDFISRAIIIRLRFDGDPRLRNFVISPTDYARRHRLAILGELAGMVLRWCERGRPAGAHRHRCDRWAAIVGGILKVAGLGEWASPRLVESKLTV